MQKCISETPSHFSKWITASDKSQWPFLSNIFLKIWGLFAFLLTKIGLDCIKLNIWQFRGLGHLILKIIFNYLSNHISNIYNKKRHYNCWTKFWDSGPSASYFSISQRAKMGYGLNILPNLCLIRILQWFHQKNQMALEFFRSRWCAYGISGGQWMFLDLT